MKITESALRKIVRQEILREASPLSLPSGSDLEGNREMAGMSDDAVTARVRRELAALLTPGTSPLVAAERWMKRWIASWPAHTPPSHAVRESQRKFVYGIVTDPAFIRAAKRGLGESRRLRESEEVDYESDPGALAKLVLADLGETGVSDIFGGLSQGGAAEDRAYRKLVGVMNRVAGAEPGSEGIEYLFDEVVGELEVLLGGGEEPRSFVDEDGIRDVIFGMGREIPRMGDADRSTMEDVLDELGKRLDMAGVEWDWGTVADVAEQENYHAVAHWAPRLKG